jgi:serpin B
LIYFEVYVYKDANIINNIILFYVIILKNPDFKEEKTLEALNKWVSDKTEGMIDPFIESFSDPELLRLYLVNAVYFNGEWSVPFDPQKTRKSYFTGKSGSITVDMMGMYGKEYRYLSENGIRGIEIPYGDGRLVMNILIPEDPENIFIDELYDGLSAEEIEAFLEKLDTAGKTEISRLELPKFEIEYGLKNLNDALKDLGMKKAFEVGGADFKQIGESLYVSAVVHKAKIKVEEWGTEASAATGIEVNTEAALLDPNNFIVDVPFIYFIRDTQTDTILFMGEMQGPGIKKLDIKFN